jgi:hypothetical protein
MLNVHLRLIINRYSITHLFKFSCEISKRFIYFEDFITNLFARKRPIIKNQRFEFLGINSEYSLRTSIELKFLQTNVYVGDDFFLTCESCIQLRYFLYSTTELTLSFSGIRVQKLSTKAPQLYYY